MANVHCIYGGPRACPQENSHQTLRVLFLDSFTMLLKYLPTGFKEIVVDCSIRVALLDYLDDLFLQELSGKSGNLCITILLYSIIVITIKVTGKGTVWLQHKTITFS